MLVFGIFNRVTFPAFLLAPGLQLIPTFRRRYAKLEAILRTNADQCLRPSVLITIIFAGVLTASLAICVDTVFYTQTDVSFFQLIRNPIITPLNNLFYNTQRSNLALHGTHPFYQHILINLPQFLGPAFPLFLFSSRKTTVLASALSGIIILSCFPHQEARFLLPSLPLIFCSVRLPRNHTRIWIVAWIAFNLALGFLMGIYHQGGVIPAQIYLEGQNNVTTAFWWKTYSPPIWLLDGRNENLTTVDLMGLEATSLESTLCIENSRCALETKVLVAPRSTVYLDQFQYKPGVAHLVLQELWSTRQHLNLDDLDFEDDGIWYTLQRVIGRRGLIVWRIDCNHVQPDIVTAMIKDW